MNHYHQACPYISFQDSFPQISNGNFMFNGVPQADFDSFLQYTQGLSTVSELLNIMNYKLILLLYNLLLDPNQMIG